MNVLDIEADEMKKLVSLEIVSITPEVSNPFHGVLQSSKERILIHAERPKGVDTLGLMVQNCTVENIGYTLEVFDILPGSPFLRTDLKVGMKIYEVNKERFDTAIEGMLLLQKVKTT